MTNAQQALQIARQQAEITTTWIELQNALFGNSAELSRLFPTREEREQFIGTSEYEEIQRMISARRKMPE